MTHKEVNLGERVKIIFFFKCQAFSFPYQALAFESSKPKPLLAGGNGDKRRKSCCFKSILFKEDVLSPGILRGSHRTRAATSLTSVKQGQFQICKKTSSSASPASFFFFLETIRPISCPPYILCLSHLLLSTFLPSSVSSKAKTITCFPSQQMNYSPTLLC